MKLSELLNEAIYSNGERIEIGDKIRNTHDKSETGTVVGVGDTSATVEWPDGRRTTHPDTAFYPQGLDTKIEAKGIYFEAVREGSWAILPATMSLYGKKVVDIITAASTWDESVIYVCSKTESSGKERILFVSSAGGGVDAEVGKSYDTHHDQTRVSKGRYTVLNVVHIKDGKIVSKKNNVGIDVKASLSVFK